MFANQSFEVTHKGVAIIVDDVSQPISRDIILEKQSGRLQRINELHPSYLGLKHPLMFPCGEDGYCSDINHRDLDDSHQRKRNRLTNIAPCGAFRP